MSQRNVLKITIPLSDQPIFVGVDSPDVSLDTIITEAVSTLQEAGRAHESQQLAQLYHDHSIIAQGQLQSKGTLFTQIPQDSRVVNGTTVNFAEIELVKQHVGGAEDPFLTYMFEELAEKGGDNQRSDQNVEVVAGKSPKSSPNE